MYSPGRWKVYSCSLRASSKMMAPESSASDACEMTRAMSNTCVRRLMAGTVKPLTSPRPRAMYSSWMLADGRPQLLGCLPDHPARRLHRAVVLAERGAPHDVPDAAGPETGLVVDDQPLAVDVGDAHQQLGQARPRTWPLGVGSSGRSSWDRGWYRRLVRGQCYPAAAPQARAVRTPRTSGTAGASSRL